MIKRREFITSLFALGLGRDQVVEQTLKAFPEFDRDTLLNQIGVELYLLRKRKVVEPLKKGRRYSRHRIIKSDLYKDKTNSQILKHLKRRYPEISEKIHKQRICEYRWFFNRGLL